MTGTRSEADTWLDVLQAAARQRPDRVAFTHLPDGEGPGQDLTFVELDRRARAVGAYLRETGVDGGRVLLWYPTGLDYLAGFFGCLYAGAVAVPAYPPSRRPRALARVQAILEDASPSCVLTSSAVRDRLPVGLEIGGRSPIATDEIDLAGAATWTPPDVDAESLAFLQYTSGSTGSPRGVMLSHRNLLANSEMIGHTFATTERTRNVSWLPMYHDMGLIGSVLHVLHFGGHTTLMSPVAFAQQPVRWLRAISEGRATAAGAPNFAFDLCVERVTAQDRADLDLSSWELAFNGAEPIRPDTMTRFAEAFARCGFRAASLTPCYGLAEATLLVSGRRAGSGVVADGPRVSCGERPPGTHVEIVDPDRGTPCPPGAAGEVWVRGPAVGQGYWNRPEESERTFRATIAGTDGRTYLRTGDLGYLCDGELHVTGRRKDMIIVRGGNHHPQDLERTVEDAHPLVRAGGTAAFATPVDGVEEVVVVAEVGARDAGLDPVELRDAAVAVRLAVAEEHEIRVHEVALLRAGTLPKTSSGKVQRHACREEWHSGDLTVLARSADTAEDTASGPPPAVAPTGDVPAVPAAPAPAGSTSRLLRAADLVRGEIADLLGTPVSEVDLDAPLTRLGLDSMGALALHHRVCTRLGVSLPLDDVVTRTGTELVELLAGADAVTGGPASPPTTTDHELPANQAALWLQHQLGPDNPSHLLAVAVRIEEPVDDAALGVALQALVARHDALRTTFPVIDGDPVARVHPEPEVRLAVVDAHGWDDTELDAAVARAAHAPFDSTTGPLLRLTLLRRAHLDHRLVLAVDHMVADLWSVEVLLTELEQLHRGNDPGPVGRYRDHVLEQRALLADREEALSAWWRQRLAGVPTLLPLARPGTAGGPIGTAPGPRTRTGSVAVHIAPDVAAATATLAASLGVTEHAVLLAAYQALLAQWTGRSDLIVGAPAHGRGSSAHARTIGLFVDLMALRARPTGDVVVADLVRAAHAEVRDGLAHAALPFARVVEAVAPERHAQRPPLVQAVLNWHQPTGPHGEAIAALALGLPGAPATAAGLAATTVALPEAGTQFDLVLTVAHVGSRLAGRLQYDTGALSPDDADALAGHLERLLLAFADTPGERLDALPAVPRPRVETEPLRDGGPLPRAPRRVEELLFEQVVARPDAAALVDGATRISYRELGSRVDALAARLRATGAGSGTLVALYLPRGTDFAVAAAAVLRAGAAYLPLEPAHPAARIRDVLDDAAPALVLVHGDRPDHDGPVVVDLAESGSEGGVECGHDSGVMGGVRGSAGLDDLAYVIYTSGSSGRPKGVPVTHRGLAQLLAGTADLGFDEHDTWMLFHSHAFDFSVWELWGALTHGGTAVVVPPGATVSAPAFWDLVRHHRVTVLNQTPAVFREMTASSPDRLAGTAVRHVILGGEKLEPAHLAPWRTHGSDDALVTNMYGLTETSVVATRGTVAPHAEGSVPIGGPIAGTCLVLLDGDARPVPRGEPGEICVSGGHLARGYLGRPALTAARFTPHPLRRGERLYRTGDLARFHADGALEYLGRADEQVQIRGHRVEPAEIAAALVDHPAVRDAVVLAQPGPAGSGRLIGFWVRADDDALPAAQVGELRAHLRQRLPDYLVPGRLVAVPAIPLTTSGKVDRDALAAADDATTGGDRPRTRTEVRVAALAGAMAEHAPPGRDDDLFDLGWHSLLMARLASRIRDEFAVDLPLEQLFADPTVERIAARIDAALPAAPTGAAAPAGIPRVDRSRYRVDAGTGLPEALRG